MYNVCNVCMYVACMCIMYVCMYVCICIWWCTDVCTAMCMYDDMMYVCMVSCVYVCAYVVWMYACEYGWYAMWYACGCMCHRMAKMLWAYSILNIQSIHAHAYMHAYCIHTYIHICMYAEKTHNSCTLMYAHVRSYASYTSYLPHARSYTYRYGRSWGKWIGVMTDWFGWTSVFKRWIFVADWVGSGLGLISCGSDAVRASDVRKSYVMFWVNKLDAYKDAMRIRCRPARAAAHAPHTRTRVATPQRIRRTLGRRAGQRKGT
jgi:hypothetical protein